MLDPKEKEQIVWCRFKSDSDEDVGIWYIFHWKSK